MHPIASLTLAAMFNVRIRERIHELTASFRQRGAMLGRRLGAASSGGPRVGSVVEWVPGRGGRFLAAHGAQGLPRGRGGVRHGCEGEGLPGVEASGLFLSTDE